MDVGHTNYALCSSHRRHKQNLFTVQYSIKYWNSSKQFILWNSQRLLQEPREKLAIVVDPHHGNWERLARETQARCRTVTSQLYCAVKQLFCVGISLIQTLWHIYLDTVSVYKIRPKKSYPLHYTNDDIFFHCQNEASVIGPKNAIRISSNVFTQEEKTAYDIGSR